jgi:tetratricopeptide (TPR) repeat protein
MSTLCKEHLYRFLDGQMPADEQSVFREHLVGCEPCSRALQESLQLELLGQMALTAYPLEPPVEARRAPRWHQVLRKRWVPGTVALAASVAVLMLVPGFGDRQALAVEWLVTAHGRPLEARLAYRAEDVPYQRHVPVEDSPGVAALPLKELARLEDRGDFHGIATACLLHGAPRQARAILERMPSSADRDCDLAVLALREALDTPAEGLTLAHLKHTYLEQALELLEGVLRQAPEHPQALWNRALVLREMGLRLLAAEAFEAVAKRGSRAGARRRRTMPGSCAG